MPVCEKQACARFDGVGSAVRAAGVRELSEDQRGAIIAGRTVIGSVGRQGDGPAELPLVPPSVVVGGDCSREEPCWHPVVDVFASRRSWRRRARRAHDRRDPLRRACARPPARLAAASLAALRAACSGPIGGGRATTSLTLLMVPMLAQDMFWMRGVIRKLLHRCGDAIWSDFQLAVEVGAPRASDRSWTSYKGSAQGVRGRAGSVSARAFREGMGSWGGGAALRHGGRGMTTLSPSAVRVLCARSNLYASGRLSVWRTIAQKKAFEQTFQESIGSVGVRLHRGAL